MMHRFFWLSLGCAMALAAPLVQAEEAPSAAEASALSPLSPLIVGATTDRQSLDRIAVQADLSYMLIDGAVGDLTALRLDLYGQYAVTLPAGLVGGYLALPVSRLSDEGNSETSAGIFELGGLYAPAVSYPVMLRVGFILNTQDSDNFEDFAVGIFTFPRRLTDLATLIPDTGWLRLAASGGFRQGQFFVRGDFGVDVGITGPDDFDTGDFAIRLNLAAGIATPQVLFAAELVNVTTSDAVFEEGESFFHTLALTARLTSIKAQPYLSLILPLDEDFREIIEAAVSIGLRYEQ